MTFQMLVDASGATYERMQSLGRITITLPEADDEQPEEADE